jgi:predicted polyphosphate/ATP-dependent NAD kinase
MGEDACREAGVLHAAADTEGRDQDRVGFVVVPGEVPERTSGEDTSRFAAHLAAHDVDLLLFAGGDGTARDVQVAIGDSTPVLGIPAGVKIQSSVFATSPAAAGRVAAAWLSSAPRRTVEREVLDLDEDAYRRGDVRPRLFGYLRVPNDTRVQASKAPTPPDDAASTRGIAESLAESLDRSARWILGPGTTVRAIADRLGVAKTLVGIDVVEWTGGVPSLVAQDVGERQLVELAATGPLRIVVTPIGGQGFLFGRGNQPLSPRVLRAVGREHIIVVATPGKLAELQGRPLLVDTGDSRLDEALTGPIVVVTGYRDRAIVPIVAG